MSLDLLVLGLDGATWSLLDPWIEEGKLETLGRLRDEGHAAPLRSCDPPVTFPAWKVITSGLPPDELGVWGIRSVDFLGRGFSSPDARTLDAPDAWDYLAEAGYRCGAVNVPGTWPVRQIPNDGVMVGDPFAQDEVTVAPPEARDRYSLGPYTTEEAAKLRSPPDDALAWLEQLEGERFDISMRLAEDLDVLYHTVFYCDPLQHHHWDDPSVLERGWRWLDERIGELIDAAEPDAVIVCSDHGFAPIQQPFNVNTWLEQEGLLAIEGQEVAGTLHRLGLTRERLMAPAKALGITEEQLSRLVPSRLANLLPNQAGGRKIRRWEIVDWSETRAISADGFQVFVRDDDAREQVVEGLRAIERPDTGQPLFARVVDHAEATGDPDAPVTMTVTDGAHVDHSFGGELWEMANPTGGWIATHAEDGVLILHGDAFEGPIEGTPELTDVAPTVLGLLGAPGPELPGRPLAGVEAPKQRERLASPFSGR